MSMDRSDVKTHLGRGRCHHSRLIVVDGLGVLLGQKITGQVHADVVHQTDDEPVELDAVNASGERT